MRMKLAICTLMVCVFMLLNLASAMTGNTKDDVSTARSNQTTNAGSALRLEGEKRFHSNCSRCHAAPPRFPSPMMGTVIRHMRVRAMLTDEDMRVILKYMTQ